MGKVKCEKMPGREFEALLQEVSQRYVTLEKGVRAVIDRVVSPICSGCERVCCRPSYCRETLRNPWYHYLFETYGAVKLEWERRDRPPGLGPTGCVIRAGRYAYCYAYNCRAVLSSLGSAEAREAFQGISDILKDVGLNFLGKRHLTDLRDWKDVTSPRLLELDKKIEEGTGRFHELCSLLFMDEPGI